MNLKRNIACMCALACAVTLALSGIASALAIHRTMANTYPVATHVCTNVRTGKEHNKRIRTFAAQILVDCQALEATFTSATATAIAAQTTLTNAIKANRASFHATCNGFGKVRTVTIRPSCIAAQAQVRILRKQLQRADIVYVTTLESARKVFWSAVKSLPRLNLKADQPVTTVNPS